MTADANLQESVMIKLPPLAIVVYKAYLRSRLERYTRALEVIAAQRENDFHAERVLHKEVVVTRSKLHSL
jgi:predicted hotdog family 3-hydroxylacyl-ACP dehydratase